MIDLEYDPYTPLAELDALIALLPPDATEQEEIESFPHKMPVTSAYPYDVRICRMRVGGMKTIEIAEELGIPHASVRTALFRCGVVKKRKAA